MAKSLALERFSLIARSFPNEYKLHHHLQPNTKISFVHGIYDDALERMLLAETVRNSKWEEVSRFYRVSAIDPYFWLSSCRQTFNLDTQRCLLSPPEDPGSKGGRSFRLPLDLAQ